MTQRRNLQRLAPAAAACGVLVAALLNGPGDSHGVMFNLDFNF